MSQVNPSEPEPSPEGAQTGPSRRRTVWLCAAIGLLAVVGMSWGWTAMVRQKMRVQAEAAGQIVAAGGNVYLDYQWQNGPQPAAQPPQPAWVRWLLGPELFDRVVAVDLSHVQANSVAISCLPALPYLRELKASSAELNDEDLVTVGRLSGLCRLDLSASSVTDQGVTHLRRLVSLRSLSLAETAVSDQSAAALQCLTGLRQLDLSGTAVSAQVGQQLRTALPHCALSLP